MTKPYASLLALLPLLLVPSAFSGGALPGRAQQELENRAAARPLGREAQRVNELVPDLAFTDVTGREGRLSQVMGKKGLVIAMRDADCPLSKKYAPRVVRLEEELAERGFGLLLVESPAKGVEPSAAKDIAKHGFQARYAVDADGRIARALAATTTTEVFVLDAARTLVYRGALDDQHGIGFSKPAPEATFLLDALAAVAAGEALAVQATTAPGCLLDPEPYDEPRGEVTWHNRVGRIVQIRCERCHRPGEAAPFSLQGLQDVARRKNMIEWVVGDRLMPPWFAEDGSGPWMNDASLTEAEREDFLAWLDADAPEGDPADAALPRTWVEGWRIGQPDLVVEIPDPITIPAEGVVEYQYAYAKTDLPEDRWVQAMEIRPGAPEVVHHVLVFLEGPEVLDTDPDAQRRFQAGLRGFFAGTVPGQGPTVFPAGMGKKLPAGAWLKFQLHYTPSGEEHVDRTRIGLRFADEPVHTEVRTSCVFNTDLVIPAGAFDFEVRAERVLQQPMRLLSFFPHTHLRGNRFHIGLVYPDGRAEDLLPIPFYDFNWQLAYELATPLEVPAGTVMRCQAWYDNSADNPANPDPTANVSWGDQTWEEMMIGYYNWVPAHEGGARQGVRR